MDALPTGVLQSVLVLAGPRATLVCREWRDILAHPDTMAAALTMQRGGGPALMTSARHGRHDVVRALMHEKNTKFDIFSALAAATECGHEACVRLLYVEEMYAELLVLLLRIAVKNGHEGVVRLLLSRVVFRDSLHGPVFCTAAQYGHERIVRLMQAWPHDDGRYNTALTEAAWNGHDATVRLLLDSHEYPEDTRDLAWNLATQQGHASTARLLRRRRACAIM